MITQEAYNKGIRCRGMCIFCKESTSCFQFKVKEMELQGGRYTPPCDKPLSPPPSQKPSATPKKAVYTVYLCNYQEECCDIGEKCAECGNNATIKKKSFFKPVE